MPDHSPFDLEAAVATWRHVHARRRAFARDDLDELERHLRDHTAHLVALGTPVPEAFDAAVRALGDVDGGAAEYRKVRWGKLRRRRQLGAELRWGLSMLRSYLTVALRSLGRHKGYAAVNLVGLAVGLACFALAVLYVQDERAFDRFHADADRIYRLVEARQTAEGDTTFQASTAPAARQALLNQVAGVEAATRLFAFWRANMYQGDRHFYEGDYLFADPSFFDVFSFELLQGDPATALAEPNTVVLTETAAQKYFGDEDPLGRTIQTSLVSQASPTGSGLADLTVTGVLRDPPPTSHLAFSMLIPARSLAPTEWWEGADASWMSGWAVTYARLAPGASSGAVEAELGALARPHWDAVEAGARAVSLQPLTDIHFGSGHIADERNQNEGREAHVVVLTAIAVLILLIACINTMNLATARSLVRSREVGLRKVVGAHRGQLVRQFLSESVLLTGLAMLLALGLVWALVPALNAFTGKALTVRGVAGPLAVTFIGAVLVVGVASGSYPAFVLSRFRPAVVLRGASGGPGGARLRQGLVVVQFALSTVLIAATLVVHQQLRYVDEAALGFEEEHLVVIDINSGVARQNFETMKAEFRQIPAVQSVTASSRVPGDWKGVLQAEVHPEGAAPAERRTTHFIGADEHFLETLRIPLRHGRAFSAERPADSAAVLVNAAAARTFGWTEPVGQTLDFPEHDFRARVVGVVEDFHFQSLHEPIGPLVIGHWNNPVHAIDYFTVRIEGDDVLTTLTALEAAHRRVDAQTLFEYNFLDERLGDFYRQEARAGTLFGIAAALAVLIACLGLFALAAFTAERRRKEIGVRRVLGASVAGVAVRLSKGFLGLVGLAFVLAAPAAWWVMQRWLSGFAYHVEVGPGVFLVTGALVLLVALATISGQALKAALADPADNLRYE